MAASQVQSGIRKIAYEDHRVVPWKNGGGMTREIAIGGTNAESDAWDWRFSMASVTQDGPFSLFPGIDRIIAIIEGGGMDLVTASGAVLPLEPFMPVPFSGDNTYHGKLRDGPLCDLNIMTRRGQFTSSLDINDGPLDEVVEMKAGQVLVVHVLVGTCHMKSVGGEVISATESETLVHDGQGAFTLALDEGSRAAVIRISPF